jgi:hypothetical protein
MLQDKYGNISSTRVGCPCRGQLKWVKDLKWETDYHWQPRSEVGWQIAGMLGLIKSVFSDGEQDQ